MLHMKKATKFGALALASALSFSLVAVAPSATAATCAKKTEVTMLGTIKDEIKDQLKQMITADQNWQKAKFSEMMQKLRAKAKIQ